MSTELSIVDYIVDQMAEAGPVRARAMFGEFGLYCGATFFGLVCDDQLFIKPTDPGWELAAACGSGIPYPRAKPHILVPPDACEDREWLAALVRTTCAALPAAAPKRRKPSA